MINDGVAIDKIYRELDDCQPLCITCHSLVTEVERCLGFTRIKQLMTRRLNALEISQEVYDEGVVKYQVLYRAKMINIYDELSLQLTPQNNVDN